MPNTNTKIVAKHCRKMQIIITSTAYCIELTNSIMYLPVLKILKHPVITFGHVGDAVVRQSHNMTCCERSRHSPPIFSPYLLRPNGCMDQDVTWYGGRPRPT